VISQRVEANDEPRRSRPPRSSRYSCFTLDESDREDALLEEGAALEAALNEEVAEIHSLFNQLQKVLQRQDQFSDRGAAVINAARPILQHLGQQLDHIHNNVWDADDAAADDIVENYVYSGERAPQNVGNAIIDESVRDIPGWAFSHQIRLTDVRVKN
jgi:hypothetical protein